MKKNVGEEFLYNLYKKDLIESDEVKHTREQNDDDIIAIKKYLDRLERIHSRANTKTKKELLFSLYVDKHVIKKENIPYNMDKEEIIYSQKKSLEMWLNYLSDPTSDYPSWAKYWAFQGMLKMGSYDEAKGIYLNRSNKTIAPFVPANPAIIAKSIDIIIKLVNKQEIDKDVEEKLNKTNSFKKIYTYFLKQNKKNIIDRSSTEGIWIKYEQGSKEDAIKLAKSLENKDTKWCTESEYRAIRQICGPYEDAPKGGDFYVFYTKDQKGEYTIPRIAIRLADHDKIREIRGILEGQNLEEKMEKPLELKLKDMTFLNEEDIKKNLNIVDDLRKLSIILQKTENKKELTQEEITDIYTKEYGFGWVQDPRVDKIILKRDYVNDFNKSNNNEVKREIFHILLRSGNEKYLKEHKINIDDSFVKYYLFKDGRGDRILDYVDKNDYLKNEEILKRTIETSAFNLFDINRDEVRDYDELVKIALKSYPAIIRDIEPEDVNNYDEILNYFLSILTEEDIEIYNFSPSFISNLKSKSKSNLKP